MIHKRWLYILFYSKSGEFAPSFCIGTELSVSGEPHARYYRRGLLT